MLKLILYYFTRLLNCYYIFPLLYFNGSINILLVHFALPPNLLLVRGDIGLINEQGGKPLNNPHPLTSNKLGTNLIIYLITKR